MMFEKEVCQLIAAHKSLRPYSLTESQWVLAKHLADVLVVSSTYLMDKCTYKA